MRIVCWENRLPADDSHEISSLLFLKKHQILNCSLLQIMGGALWVKAETKQKK